MSSACGKWQFALDRLTTMAQAKIQSHAEIIRAAAGKREDGGVHHLLAMGAAISACEKGEEW